MKSNELMVYVIVVAVVWLLPVIVCLTTGGILRKTIMPLLAQFKRQSLPVQIFFAVLVCAAVLRGGSKNPVTPDKPIPGDVVTPPADHGDADVPETPVNPGDADRPGDGGHPGVNPGDADPDSDADDGIPSDEFPCFNRVEYVFETFTGFAIEEAYEIHNLQRGNVALKKVGKGKLPPGVKMKWDKKSQMVLLSGAASKAGTYEYIVRAEEGSGKSKRIGIETKFVFEVIDLAKLPPSDRNFNASAGKKIKVDLPVFSDAGIYAGNINVSVTPKGVITAKIKGVTKKVLSFKGNWQSVEEGAMGASIRTKTGEQLNVVVNKNGNLCASLSGGALNEEIASADHGVFSTATAADYAKYVGTHNVETVDGIKLTLKIAKTGKVTYAPADKADTAHKAYKGTAQLLLNAYEDGAAQVWLVKQTKALTYAHVIRVD